MNEIKTTETKKARRRNTVETGIIYGKVPPQAKELEEAILGAIMLVKSAFDDVVNILRPECFYAEAHQRIFKAMIDLSKKNHPIDLMTVVEQLRYNEELEMVGGIYAVSKLTNSVVSSANIEYHSRIVLQKFIQRELIRIGGEIISESYEDSADVFDLLDGAESKLSELQSARQLGDMTGIDQVAMKALQQIEEWRKSDSHVTGVASGFTELDRATRGWQNGDLIIIAARPSVGKTAFALNIARNAAQDFKNKRNKKKVAIWSLEMKSLMLFLRMLSAESNEVLFRLQTGRIDDAGMKNVFEKGIKPLTELPIVFDDIPGLTISKLKTKARKMARKGELGLIIIDYLQLMTPDESRGNREQEVSKISRNLKLIAQELDVPIIALSQMSRDVEKRVGAHRKPQLSDLRESGSIEQDADVVAFLWAPEDKEIAEDASLVDIRFFRIAKQRNGFLLTMNLDFKDEIQHFSELNKMPELGAGNWSRVDTTEAGPKLFIQPVSKTSSQQDFDEGFNEDL